MNELQKFIKDFFEPLAHRFTVLEDENRDLKRRLNILENNNSTSTSTTSFSYSSLFDNVKKNECSSAVISMVKKDLKLQESKERNIVITGLPKPTITDNKIDTNKDNELIKTIFAHMEIETTSIKYDSQRIRKDDITNNTNNPILIKFYELKDKLSILKNSKKLKTFNTYKIIINNDLTDSDRDFEKALRDERRKRNSALDNVDSDGLRYGLENSKKFYYGIRNGSVKKIFRD
jgi:hypothetical protein